MQGNIQDKYNVKKKSLEVKNYSVKITTYQKPG